MNADRLNMLQLVARMNSQRGFNQLQALPVPRFEQIRQDLFRPVAGSQEMCVICLEECTEDAVVPSSCQLHTFHRACLQQWIREKPTCPTCKQPMVYCRGFMPVHENNYMHVQTLPCKLAGFPEHDTLKVEFYVFGGRGIPQYHHVMLLPNNQEGQDLAGQLRKAWKQRLLFDVRNRRIVPNHIRLSRLPSLKSMKDLRADLKEVKL